MEWLVDAGHACHILTTARFESPVTFTIEEHLAGRARGAPRKRSGAQRPVVSYATGTVPVTLLVTRCNDEQRPDRAEADQYLTLVDELLEELAPDVLIACNGHPMIFEAMARARTCSSRRLLLFGASATTTHATSRTSITRSRAASS